MSSNRNDEHLAARIAELEDSLRARTFELDVLHALSQKIGHSLNYDELFHALLTHLENAVACDVVAGLLITEERRELYLRRLRPLTAAAQDEVEDRLLTAYRRMTAVPIERDAVHRRLLEADQFGQAPPLTKLASFFQVPILSQDQTVGFILVGSAAAGSFNEDQIRLLYTVSHQAASALERLKSVLALERRRLQAVVENVPDGLVLLDGEQRITMTNPAGATALRALARAEAGEKLTHLNGQSFEEMLARSDSSDRDDLHLKGPLRQILEPTIIPLDAAPLPERWLLVLRDVTEARKAVRQRDRFLAMLAHELRNPLAAMTSANALLRMEAVPHETHQQALKILTGQTAHLARLVDDLLDVSRVLHDKISLQRQPLDLARLVNETAETYRPVIEERGQVLTVDACSDPLWVDGDRVRLAQVFTNLLGNAAKYSPPGARITVGCARDGGDAVIRVCDTGLGIAPEKLTDIFEPFLQLDDALDRSNGGLGLGLALVQILVERHGGRVAAQSDGLDCGSEFVISLPALSAPERAEPEDITVVGRTAQRILLIEDNRAAREMLSKLLEVIGHEVVTASTGLEGIDQFRRHRPDVVLLDIGLPDLDGYQVAQRLRSLEDGREVRLVALTGYGQLDDKRRTKAAGFDAHLVKPVGLDDLQSLLQRFAEHHRRE